MPADEELPEIAAASLRSAGALVSTGLALVAGNGRYAHPHVSLTGCGSAFMPVLTQGPCQGLH